MFVVETLRIGDKIFREWMTRFVSDVTFLQCCYLIRASFYGCIGVHACYLVRASFYVWVGVYAAIWSGMFFMLHRFLCCYVVRQVLCYICCLV